MSLSSLVSQAESIVGQVTSAVSSISTPLTAVSNAVANVAKDVQPLTNPSLIQRANQLKQGAQDNLTKLKEDLLAGDVTGAHIIIDGLRGGIGIELSESEYSRLSDLRFTLSGNDLLGFGSAALSYQLQQNLDQLQALDPAK